MKLSSLVCLATLVALAPMTITSAHAQAFAFTGGSAANVDGATVGETFTVGAGPFTVTTLGIWDFNQDGLAAGHLVTIWNGSGTVLTSASVPAGTTGTLVGQYRYSNVLTLPLTLAANTTYTIGAFYPSGNDLSPFVVPLGNITSASGVAYGAARIIGGNAFPTTDASGVGHYVSANFQSTSASASTPEPGSVALLGAVFMAGAGFVRRRRSVRQR